MLPYFEASLVLFTLFNVYSQRLPNNLMTENLHVENYSASDISNGRARLGLVAACTIIVHKRMNE